MGDAGRQPGGGGESRRRGREEVCQKVCQEDEAQAAAPRGRQARHHLHQVPRDQPG